MNRNTRKTTGHFYTSITTEDKKEEFIIKKKIPCSTKNNKIEPTKPIDDETLKMKLKLSVFLNIWEF
ncbi:tandem-type lipoprotein [Staphylococcus epidermidis]|nr:tandem-type lipoprotein [Staphylococcus epidermidis]